MKINDEGTSNAAYWYERAMKAEARLAEAERLLKKADPLEHCATSCDYCTAVSAEIDAFLRPTVSASSEANVVQPGRETPVT